MRKSVRIALISIFGALHAVLYLISFGLWRNWAIYLAPIEGIILGPSAGFLAAFLGSSIPRIALLDPLFIFGIVAEPVSVLSAGLLSRGKWKPVLAIYAAMLSAYFLHPFGRQLPLWTIIDILAALFIIYPAAMLSKSLFSKNVKLMSIALVSLSFVCTATDALARIFLLIPIGLHVSSFPRLRRSSNSFHRLRSQLVRRRRHCDSRFAVCRRSIAHRHVKIGDIS